MHVIVVGCGRVGSEVALNLAASDEHDVVIIDRKPDAFRRLGDNFKGTTMVGVGFDRDLLIDAGISPDCAVAAVTSGDNSNILIARTARETFGVARVVARIYDPRRASIYERLGIATVASVTWTSARVLRHLLGSDSTPDWIDPSAKFTIIERRVPGGAAGLSVAHLEEAARARVAVLSRFGDSSIPPPATLLQEDDMVQVVVAADNVDALDAALHNRESH